MRVIGLDPGLRHTGWGVVEVTGSHVRHVADGAIHSDERCALAERLCQLANDLTALLALYRPDEAAVEEVFVNVNPRSTLKLGMARGVALLLPAQAGLPVTEYAAAVVKKAVVGNGAADKTQVQAMVRMLLPGSSPGSADAADALAVALCHAHHRSTLTVWHGTPAAAPSRVPAMGGLR